MTTTRPDPEMAATWPVMAAAINRRGVSFTPASQVLPGGLRGHCFVIALAVAASRRWLYAEGLAEPPHAADGPQHHAWVIDPAGLPVECTWPTPARSYVGVTFTPAEARAAGTRRDRAGRWVTGSVFR